MLSVVACGNDVKEAREKVYDALSKISFDGLIIAGILPVRP